MKYDFTLLWLPQALNSRHNKPLPQIVGKVHIPNGKMMIGFDDPSAFTWWAAAIASFRWPGGSQGPYLLRMNQAFARRIGKDGCAELPVVDAPSHEAEQRVIENLSRGDRIMGMCDWFVYEEDAETGRNWVTPIWENPLLPASFMVSTPEWRRAASAVGTLLFGVAIDPDGHMPFSTESQSIDQPSNTYVVIPRHAIPHPYLNEARRWRVTSQRS